MDKYYDAFITYRAGADATEANALYDILLRNQLVPAIDIHDFSPAETFLNEMARCVSHSRYTIALISPRYATSHFPQEEAIMQQILDNREQQRRLIVAYLEDCPAPLWMQSRVGVRLFLDKGNKTQPELRRLIKLLLLRGEPSTKEQELAVEAKIESAWNNLPKQVLEFGIYGFAGYGVLSAIADMDLDVAKDATKDMAGGVLDHVVTDQGRDSLHDAVMHHGHSTAEHIKDNSHDIVVGVGHVIKHILDDLW